MQLTLFSDYALRTLMYLASRDGEQTTLRELATAYGVSLEHLRKVVHKLAQAGLVETRQGRGGGIRLGKPATEIRVGQVVRLMEGNAEPVDCEGRSCILLPACTLRDHLHHAANQFYASLDEKTLADIIGQGGQRKRLIALRPE